MVNKPLLTPPGEGATDADLRAWGELVSQTALPGTTIEIAGCVAVPEALAIDAGNDFTVTNAGKVPHTLVLNPTTTFLIPANSSKTIKANFEKGPGIYAFGCDNKQGAVGVFLVK
jgi:plastocyanin